MLSKSLFFPLTFISILLSSCEFHCSVNGVDITKKQVNNQPIHKDGAKLYNGIDLTVKNMKVNKAYLITDDSLGDRIGPDNMVDVRRGVKMVILIDSGWTVTNGKVFPGGYMSVKSENGDKVLEVPDIFKDYAQTGVTPEDAKIIALSIFFKKEQVQRPLTLFASFKLLDKRSDAFIEGNYTVYTN